MEKVRYMISDAADMVHVETHVLRYWEEELDLVIPRNEMGHRYYTRDNIKEFQKIKDLKEQGYQLRAIRMILHSGDLEGAEIEKNGDMQPQMSIPAQASVMQQAGLHQGDELTQSANQADTLSPEDRMSQFRELMSDIVGQAIAHNNEELSQTIGRDVQEMVLKEMNYLMREQENAQEERYLKLDAAIRGNMKKKSFFSKKNKESAKENKEPSHGFFSKKKPVNQ